MQDTQAVVFSCNDSWLYGLLEIPDGPAAARALLIVVGGPQYRVGSHRQFVLLARDLASHGIPVLRFDHRGIGDSDGEPRAFDNLDDDIQAAIDALCDAIPSIGEVIIWGLCDAASAAMIYAHTDPRVKGIVLLNPWVRSEQSLARSYLGQYYVAKLTSKDFWRRLITGKLRFRKVVTSYLKAVRTAFAGPPVDSASKDDVHRSTSAPFQERMREGLQSFTGEVLLVLSGDDLTATEFNNLVRQDRRWRRLVNRDRVTTKRIERANHTFSSRDWRDQVSRWTLEWIRSW